MNMRRVAYLVLLLILAGKSGFGQIDDFAWSDFSQAGNRNNGKLIGTKYIYTIYGNANFFYHADWYPGTLTTSEGEKYSDCSLRYDAINDALVAFNPRVKAFFVVDKYLISSFSVEVPGGKAQRFIKLAMEESGRADHFYEILYEGKVSLLSHNRIIERTTTVYKNMFGELDNRKYDLEKQLYIKLSDQDYRRISPGRQSILNLFPEQKKEIRRLLRNNRINDFTWEGIPRIVEMLDGANFF